MTARALVVGVPATSVNYLPSLKTVTGDATEVARLLGGRGVDVWLHAGGITVESFSRSLLDLREVTAPGDMALLYFSGHGFRVPDNDGDEWDDAWDECLVLSDNLLRDDWFRDSFWPRTRPNTKWVTCIDSCFSASAVRGIGVEPPPIQILPVKPKSGSWRIDLAAAPDDEIALQLTGKAEGFGKAMGWMTVRVLEHLAASPEATYRTMWSAVQERARTYRQSGSYVPLPQLRYSATDDSLLDSRALSTLDW